LDHWRWLLENRRALLGNHLLGCGSNLLGYHLLGCRSDLLGRGGNLLNRLCRLRLRLALHDWRWNGGRHGGGLRLRSLRKRGGELLHLL
jgi:hypothetical protein